MSETSSVSLILGGALDCVDGGKGVLALHALPVSTGKGSVILAIGEKDAGGTVAAGTEMEDVGERVGSPLCGASTGETFFGVIALFAKDCRRLRYSDKVSFFGLEVAGRVAVAGTTSLLG